MSATKSIAVIGGGPAGLRAAEVAAQAGATVTVYDAKRSVGRKFLVAGKSGLNLTNTAGREAFASVYSGGEMPVNFWRDCLAEFDNDALRKWALELGVETFASSGGKVFPVMKKAAPLLRRWVARLRNASKMSPTRREVKPSRGEESSAVQTAQWRVVQARKKSSARGACGRRTEVPST